MNLLELFIKIGADDKEANEALDNVENKANGLTSKVGKGLATAAKVGAAAIGAAATAVAGMTKQATSAYGEYQQLSGGIETLYKGSAAKMMQYANKAFATAGLSVNQYMTTAIESSAAMINSLGGDTEKAAEMTNMAIVDMSDNVNKMGTTMESLQNAYRGFSRGNFTMLDNLSLGFAGTKEGMKQLLEKAKELSGVDYNIESYSDIVQAIHVVQSEMGITGTTAKEGAETITGSMAAVKAAWENLITGLADPNADIGKLIDNVVDNAEVAFENMFPAIEHALVGIGNLIEKVVPIIADKLPGIMEKILPPLLKAATSLVISLVKALPKLIPIIVQMLPGVISQIWDAIISIVQSQSPMLAGIMETIGKVISGAFGWIVENGDLVLDILTKVFKAFMAYEAIGFVIGLIEGIATAVEILTAAMSANPIGLIIVAIVALIAVLKSLWDNNEDFRNAILGIWEDIKNGASELLDWLVSIFTSIAEWFGNLVQSIKDFFTPLIEWLSPFLEAMANLFANIFALIKQTIMDEITQQKDTILAGWQAIVDFVSPILENLKQIVDTAFTIIKATVINRFTEMYNEAVAPLQQMWNFVKEGFNVIKEFITGIVDAAKGWGRDLVLNFVGGITANRDQVVAGMDVITSAVKSRLHFSEPDEGPLSDFHTYAPDMMQLFADGIKENAHLVTDQIDKSFDLGEDITASVDGSTAEGTPQNAENGALGQVIALLQIIASKDINFDAQGIYTLVRDQNSIYREANGGASGL